MRDTSSSAGEREGELQKNDKWACYGCEVNERAGEREANAAGGGTEEHTSTLFKLRITRQIRYRFSTRGST